MTWPCAPVCAALLVTDETLIAAHQLLWDQRRVVLEHSAATAISALTTRAYHPRAGERLAIVVCGANTDPSDLI